MESSQPVQQGLINLGTREEPNFTVVRVGEDTDDRSSYAATATYHDEFPDALAELHRLRPDYPHACMRYMPNDPDLGFMPYWEVDRYAEAMFNRTEQPVEPATYRALVQGGMSDKEAVMLSGIRRVPSGGANGTQ